MIEKNPLYVKAKEALLELISGTRFPGNRLPSEAHLCSEFGISRTTLREALIALNREGFITKKHGLGNLVHPTTLNETMRIDRIGDFRSLLENGGYAVSVDRKEPRWVEGGEADSLFEDLNPRRGYLLLENLYSADGKPVIYSRNFILADYLRRSEGFMPLNPSGFNEQLQSLVTEEVVQSLKRFEPSKASPRLAEILELEEGESLIRWEENHISIFDNLVCRSLISFNPHLVKLAFLTKWK